MNMKWMAAVLAATMTCGIIGTDADSLMQANAGDTLQCTYYSGTDIGRQNGLDSSSKNAAMPVATNLVALSNGTFMRVEGAVSSLKGSLLVEYYDKSFKLTSRKTVAMQLPVYGAFYKGTDGYYYVVSGQNNAQCSNTVAVYDVAKYSTDWKLLGHDQLKGVNTTIPFDAGSARCDDNGRYLLIHTCHEMYSGHQANVMIEFDMTNMKITDSLTAVSNSSKGYVSHSFNQFIMLDGKNIVTLNHGDCYPRSVVLAKFNTDYTAGKFITDTNLKTSLVNVATYAPLPSAYSNSMYYVNYTGVSVGGFEKSSTHYLTAYNTIDQSKWNTYVGNYYSYSGEGYKDTRNIVISAVPTNNLADSAVTTYQITNYANGEPAAYNPHLTQISTDKFLLSWQQASNVNYVFLNGKGATTSKIYTMEGEMSDCEPIVSGSMLYWSTWRNADVTFYSINLNSPTQTKKVVSHTDHNYKLDGAPDANGVVYTTCTKCGNKVKHIAPTDFKLQPYYQDANGGMYWNGVSSSTTLDAGQIFSYNPTNVTPSNIPSEDNLYTMEITSGAENLTLVEGKTFKNHPVYSVNSFGDEPVSFTMTVTPVYNPSLKKSVTITTKHKYQVKELVEPTETKNGYAIYECKGCGHTKKETLTPFTVASGKTASVSLYKTSFEYDHYSHLPSVSITVNDPKTRNNTYLQEDKDFTVTYSNNLNAGTATAVVTALPSCTLISGTKVLTFQITPQDLSECTYKLEKSNLDPDDPNVDVMQALRPIIHIYDKQGVEIPSDDYYPRGYCNYNDDWTTISSLGCSIFAMSPNYTGCLGFDYPIEPLDITKYKATFTDATVEATRKVNYTGQARKPAITLTTSKGKVLWEGVDFEVTYKNNSKPGTATATVKGIGVYTGTITMTFTIG